MVDIHTPEELAKLGKKTYEKGDYQEAADIFAQAAAGFQAKEDVLMAAEMANNQSVALLQAGDAEGALAAVAGTEIVFEQANDRLRLAMTYGNRGGALDALDRLEEAEEAYMASSDLFKELGEDQMRAQVQQSISTVQMRSGRQLEALASMQAGVDGVKRPNVKQRMLKRLLKWPFKFLDR